MHPLTSRRLRILAVLVVTLGVAGCGKDAENLPGVAAGDPGGSCGYVSGTASGGVRVAGDFGKTVTTTFAKPVAASRLERTVVSAGNGKATKKGDPVSVVYTLVNGKDGAQLDHEATVFLAGSSQVQTGFRAGVDCVTVGSRVVATFPARDLYGDGGDPSRHIADSDPLVLVTDVLEVPTPPKTAEWTDAPAVTFHGRQSPQVTLPGTLPTGIAVHVIQPGTGAVVASTDIVSVNYVGIDARTATVFTETYGKGNAPVSFAVSQFVPGVTAAIVGQRAGAQLIVSVPPDGWYTDAMKDVAGLEPTDTLVFVVEIQSTAPSK